ncbi:hypothetical protein [Chryseobacterium wanjuense]
MDVLKDAASTAIYGSRGANGVILIQTKEGKKENWNIHWILIMVFRPEATTKSL